MAMPSNPGSSPGMVYGLMSWFSSRSIVTEPIRIAIPNAIQPIADRKSPRRLASCFRLVG